MEQASRMSPFTRHAFPCYSSASTIISSPRPSGSGVIAILLAAFIFVSRRR
jgi:hypothetical protein